MPRTVEEVEKRSKQPLFLCYRPNYIGPPKQIPASLAHPAFGQFLEAVGNTERMPSQEALHLTLQLTQNLMPK
jgi:hypothetical protein